MDIILPLSNLSGAMGVEWDDQTNQLFWTDIFVNTINVANIDVSFSKPNMCDVVLEFRDSFTSGGGADRSLSQNNGVYVVQCEI